MSCDPAIEAVALRMNRPGAVVTWLNHWSIGRANWAALEDVDVIGVDGTLLQMMLRSYGLPLSRTSADLVLPVFFDIVLAPGSRVALIGAEPGVARTCAAKVERMYGHKVRGFDGYAQLRALREDPAELADCDPAVIVLGLGAGLQDEVAVELSEQFPEATICTAGGWIDQFATKEQYFPHWIHRLRLGWAWRIAHEPRRLIRRYTLDALGFLFNHHSYLRRLRSLAHEATHIGLAKALDEPAAG